MASSSSGIIRALLVIVFVGIVFYGINWLLEPVTETANSDGQVASTPDAELVNDGSASPQTEMSAAEAEAQRYGAEIGRRVGMEIGRQVGLAAVAGLQAAGVEPGTVQAATEDEEVDEMEEAAPVVAAKPKPAPEPKPAPVVAAKPKPEPKPAPAVAAKPEPEPEPEPVEEPIETAAAPAPAPVAAPASEVAMQSSSPEPEVEVEAEETAPEVKKNLRRWLPNRTSPRP